MKKIIILTTFLLNYFVPADIFSQTDVLLSFRNDSVLSCLGFDGIAISGAINHENLQKLENRPNLKLSLEVTPAGKRGASVTYTPKVQPKLSLYKALHFWVYLPSEKDDKSSYIEQLRVFINRKSEVGYGSYELSSHYLKAGWNYVRYDFGSNMEKLEDLKMLTVTFSMNQYFTQGNIYLDKVELERMDKLEGTDLITLGNILSDQSTLGSRDFKVRKNGDPTPATTRDRSWSQRYEAIARLQASNNEIVVPGLLEACKSEVALVRNRSREALVSMGTLAIPILRDKFKDRSCLIRQFAVEIIAEIGLEKCGPAIIPDIKKALVDANYYVRDAAIRALQAFGESNEEIVSSIIFYLGSGNAIKIRIDAAETLSEMSMLPGLYSCAKVTAIPELLAIVQNSTETLELRLYALTALWKLDEDAVPVSAWLLPLQADPGEGHRFTFNKAMAALEKAGKNAVPLLREALKKDNAIVKTRVATLLMAMGTSANDAVPELTECLNDEHWYVRREALKALESMGINPAYKTKGFNPPEGNSSSKVTVTEEDHDIIKVDNGMIALTFSKKSREDGPLSLQRKGESRNLILGSGYFHWLCDRPLGEIRELKVAASTDEYADVSIFRPSGNKAVVDFDVHYILRKGESGFYTYITVRKKPEKPDMVISFFDFLLRTQQEIFSTLVFHDKYQGPSFSNYSFSEDEKKQMKDIFQAVFRYPNGELNAKHEWQNHEYISNVSGAYGKDIGIWTIHPSWDYFGAAFPNCIRMMNAGAWLISSLDNKYYFHGGCVVTGDFEKTYGPFYTYLNKGENGAEMWADAKRQAEVEMAQWPYKWFENKEYHERTTLKGQIVVTDGTSADSTWIILSHPDSTYGWQRDTGPYMFWVRSKTDGSFEIPNVHPGHYTLFANKEGVWGEFRKDNIEITANHSIDLGKLAWTPSNHGKLYWQIGIPDRTSKEFRNGNNFGQWDNYLTYRPCFPNDVDFVIGKSNYRKDWNYVHPAVAPPDDNKGTPWKIHFNLDKIPKGNLLLTIAISSTRQTFLKVMINNSFAAQYNYPYNKDDDSAGIRTAAYGLYTCHTITIDKAWLKTGENCITLVQTYLGAWSNVLYDCIKLEEVDNLH